MKTEFVACEYCGVVIDLESLRNIESRKADEQKEKEQFDGSYDFRDYGDFIKFKCPVCKGKTQI